MSPLADVKAADVDASLAIYQSSVTQISGNPLNLRAELNYNNALTNQPIAVVMHQFSQSSGNFADYRSQAQHLRDKGFFVVTVAMRGRDGSQGTRDSGGVEIYDIYDAVEYVKSNFSGLVDENSVIIEGYSGGGGNTMSAITKFPDYFKAAGAFFGMSDYGYDGVSTANGWYNNGASSGHKSILNADIGNPNTGGNTVLDRYLARNSALASQNNPYTDIHLFVNSNESTSPPINDTKYRDNAIAAATFAGEFDNINVHIGNVASPTYQDFNNNGLQDSGELQLWPHQAPTPEQQDAAENWYVPGVLNGSTLAPVLNDTDILYIAGFVKTMKFEAWLGDGQDAAGLLEYNLEPDSLEFLLQILSSDKTKTGWLDVSLSGYEGQALGLYRNGELELSFTAGNSLRIENFADGDSLLIQSVPEPALAAQLIAGGALLGLATRRRRRSISNSCPTPPGGE